MKLGRVVAASIIAALCVVSIPLSYSSSSAEALGKGRSKSSARTKSSKKAKSAKPSRTARSSKSTRSAKASRSSRGKSAKLSKRERARARAEAAARRRAELARLAAIRRADEAMRDVAMANIAQDDLRAEDSAVRGVALAALGRRAGTVVVMDPNNGRVHSIVNQRMAIATGIKPCSTFKPVVALAAMREKLFTGDDSKYLRGCGCDYDLDDALAYSNNEFFQQLGLQLGLEKLCRHARECGFGEPTGINLPGETAGLLPAEIPSDGLGRVASHGDGIRLTAIQLAAFASAIANGGSLYQPQVVKPGQTFVPILKRQIDLDPTYRRAILEGMTAAVNYGTAKRARNDFDQVAGKTGSCIESGSWDGLFYSFSSVDNPNLVVVVITRGSASRGSRAADIAGQIYQGLAGRFGSIASRPRRVDAEPMSGLPALSNR
jgi:penicillin-binding protein 2